MWLFLKLADKICILEKQATEVILVGWFGKCQSIKKVGGRRFVEGLPVSGSLFVSPCPPECDFQSETKIEPDFRLLYFGIVNTHSYKYRWFFYSKLCFDVTEWLAHVDTGGPSSLQERGRDSCLGAELCYKRLFTKVCMVNRSYHGFRRHLDE